MLLAPCSQWRFCHHAFLVFVSALLLGFGGCRGDSSDDSSDSSLGDSTNSSSADQVDAVEDIPIPSLDADGLFQFMVDLDKDPLPPEPDERSKVVRQRCRARVFASEKILQEDIPPESKTSAVRMKLDALRTLSIVEPDGLGKQFETYSQQLIGGNDPLLARLAKAVRFQARVNDYVSYRKDEPDQLLQDLDQLLSEKDAGPMVFEAARESSKWLFPGEADDDETFHKRILLQAKFLRRIGNRYLKHENSDLAEEAITVLVQADALELSALSDHVLAGKPDADQKLGSFLNELLSKKPPQPESIELAIQTAQRMEYEGQFRLALQIYQLTVKRAAENNLETETVDLERVLENAKKWLTILGEEFKIQGVQIDGSKFDWAEYRGKHVIVFFWASWFEHWDEEVQNVTAQVDAIGQDRLAVVTVNLDDDKETAKTFLQEHKINWPVVVSPDPNLVGLESPMATRYGVEAIPFMVLISPEGKVLDIHVFGRRLSESLEKALNAATSSVLHHDGLRMVAFQTSESPVDADANSIESDSGANDAISNRNPYAPPAGLSAFELLEFIWDMQEKPSSIQQRPGFTDGIVTAANQILDSDATAKQKQEATMAILKFRHQDALANFNGAESKLQAAIQRFAVDENAKVQNEIQFLQLEQRTLDTNELDDADRQKLLEQVAAFAKDHSLGERHLRLASNTVATINRFASSEVREPWFEQFGELFAASEHRTLARYGKRIAAQESSSDIVGQPFELAGVTVAGLPFDVQEYRDHYVVVDFWATWCGPCVRAIPELKSLHETFAEQGVKVVGVSLDEDLEALGKFLEKENLPWTIVAGKGTEDAAKKYKVSGIPTLILVSPEGKIEAVSHSVGDIKAALTEKFTAETAEPDDA